jgi:hypothetical protein
VAKNDSSGDGELALPANCVDFKSSLFPIGPEGSLAAQTNRALERGRVDMPCRRSQNG